MKKCDVCKFAKCRWVDKDPKKLGDFELEELIEHNMGVIEMKFRGHQGSAHAEERMYDQLSPYTDEQEHRKQKAHAGVIKTLHAAMKSPKKKPVASDTQTQYTGGSMNKNVVKTIRINDQVLKLLEQNGLTVQQLFDWALTQKVSVKTTIKFKK
jgi:hypothetical protein